MSIPAILTLFITLCLYFFVRKKLWFSVVDSHTPCMCSLYKQFGNNPLVYFNIIGPPLSYYISSISFGRSKTTGQYVYDLAMTCTGLFAFVIALQLSESYSIAYISTVFFLLCTLTPDAFVFYSEPEAFANFFSMIGISLVLSGVNFDHKTMTLSGVAIACLGFYSKLSTPEILWCIIYIFLASGIGKEFYLSSSMLLVMVFVLIFLTHKYGNRVDLSVSTTGIRQDTLGKFFYFLKTILQDTLRLYNLPGRSNFLRQVFYPSLKHLSVVFPFISLFILGYLYSNLSVLNKKLLLIWILVSFLPAIIRLQFLPVRYFMAHLPVSIGAAYGFSLIPSYYESNPLLVCSIFIIVVCICTYNLIKLWPRKRFKAHNDQLEEIIGFLKNKVSQDDYIFQDAHLTQLYYELDCNGPIPKLFWGNLIYTFFNNPDDLNELVEFFKNKKPKYYITIGHADTAASQKLLNICYLERITNLNYKIVFCNDLVFIYQLIHETAAWLDSKIDPTKLFSEQTDCRQKKYLEQNVAQYLNERVDKNDNIFQNSQYSGIYKLCKAKHPEKNFYDVSSMECCSNGNIQKLLSYFIEKKPIYYIGLAPSTINITALEKLTGLRYELEARIRCNIYRLAECDLPIEHSTTAELLFKFDVRRSRKDIGAYLQKTSAKHTA